MKINTSKKEKKNGDMKIIMKKGGRIKGRRQEKKAGI